MSIRRKSSWFSGPVETIVYPDDTEDFTVQQFPTTWTVNIKTAARVAVGRQTSILVSIHGVTQTHDVVADGTNVDRYEAVEPKKILLMVQMLAASSEHLVIEYTIRWSSDGEWKNLRGGILISGEEVRGSLSIKNALDAIFENLKGIVEEDHRFLVNQVVSNVEDKLVRRLAN